MNVRGMMSNRHLARSISDMGLSEFRRQLECKALMRGGIVIVADRWFASSKLCSFCGEKNTLLTLSIRQWTCCQCGTKHDRPPSSTVSVFGENDSGRSRKTLAQPVSKKQEVNTIATYG